MKEKNPEVES